MWINSVNTGKPYRQNLEYSEYSINTSTVGRKVRQENKPDVASMIIVGGAGLETAHRELEQ